MNKQQKVYEMLEGFDTAMLVTSGPEGDLEARPMQVAEVEPAGPVWLITAVSTRKVEEVAHDPQVLLICQDERQYLSVRGHARIVRDDMRLRRIWRESYLVWFPAGPEDPDLRLLAVDPLSAEFWDHSGTNRLRFLWESAKFLAGEQPHTPDSADEHGRTQM